MQSVCYLVLAAACAVSAQLDGPLKRVEWMVGKWRSEYGGKLVWPTVPTMTYGEELEIWPAPSSYESGIQFLNVSSRAWSHSTKDHFLDLYGFLTVDEAGKAVYLTSGNNGFSTHEEGTLPSDGAVELRLKNIGRISIAREIPVEDVRRHFRKVADGYIEQVIEMRTAQHPQNGLLEHARVLYEKVH